MKINIHEIIETLQKVKKENEPLLYEVVEKIQKTKREIEHLNRYSKIDDNVHAELFENLVRCITILGEISNPIFEKQDEIEEYYTMAYLSNPNLGRLLYEKQIYDLHMEYDLNKNRCYSQIDLLDESYIRKFKKNPPNYNSNVRECAS